MYRWFLALRWLVTRPINLLGVLAVTVGVWALIVVVSIFSGYLTEIGRHLQSSTSDATVVRLPDDARFARIEEVLRRDPNVAAVAPRIVWQGLVHPLGDDAGKAPPPAGMAELGAPTPFVAILGVDFEKERDVSGLDAWVKDVADGSVRASDPANPLAQVGDLPAVMLGRQRMQDDGARRGERVKVTTGRLVADRSGERLDFDDGEYVAAGAFESSFAAFDAFNVFVDIATLRAQLRSGERRVPDDWCNEIAIRLHDPRDAEATVARLTRLLDAIDDAPRGPGLLVRTWAEANKAQIGNVEHQRSLMKLVLFVIMVVAAFQVYSTMSMTVTEKQHDIGILTALGARRAGVLSLFLTSGIAIATVGAVLGVGLGCLSAIGLDDFNTAMRAVFDVDLFPVRVYNLKRVPYELDPTWIGQVAGVAIALGALVAAVPAWRASRHDPAVSLRND
ncbi:MAG: ABC transporter permease [Planctomycetes bacterium]|nr:ABC transporter permease [Planctomycetota bacterium]